MFRAIPTRTLHTTLKPFERKLVRQCIPVPTMINMLMQFPEPEKHDLTSL
jgi:acyl-coenzyme A synthetase/AMP-(fatty) acid ligase